MFFISNFDRCSLCCFSAVICLFSLTFVTAQDFFVQQDESNFSVQHDFHEHEWVQRYFNSVDESTSLEELVDFLMAFRINLSAKGCDTPSLSSLWKSTYKYLQREGLAFLKEIK